MKPKLPKTEQIDRTPQVWPDVCLVKNPSDGFKVDGRDGFARHCLMVISKGGKYSVFIFKLKLVFFDWFPSDSHEFMAG